MTRDGPHLTPKPPSASHSEMLQLVLPSDANTLGNALGGVVMHHMDIVAAIAAQRHAGQACVTASVDRIDFRSPVRIGELLVLGATVNLAARLESSVARPGQIVISDSTRQALGPKFISRPLGEQALKGIAEDVRCHELLPGPRIHGLAPDSDGGLDDPTV